MCSSFYYQLFKLFNRFGDESVGPVSVNNIICVFKTQHNMY